MRNQGLCTRLGKSGDSVLRRYKAGTQYSVWRVISYYLTTTSADEVNLIREGRIEAECRSLLNFRTYNGFREFESHPSRQRLGKPFGKLETEPHWF